MRGSPTRARRRVSPERFVVRAAIVVAGQTETHRGPEDQQRRREWQPRGPPARLRSEQTVRRIPEQLGRVERREIRAEIVVRALERGPGRVNDERRETAEHHERLHPPGVAPRRCTEPPGNLGYLNVGHGPPPPSRSPCSALRSVARKAGRIISHGTVTALRRATAFVAP